MGAKAYTLYGKYRHELPPGAILEIGASRGEGSTEYLRVQAAADFRKFYSVDVNNGDWEMSGEFFLLNLMPAFQEHIAFAYLDNFDWTYKAIENEPWLKDQVAQYARMGVVMDNENSQLAHKNQARLVDRFAVAGSMILFDDTWRVIDEYEFHGVDGKGGTAVRWLVDNGWEIIEQNPDVPPGGECLDGFVLLRKTQ